ncbi:MAG: hypothetical protein ACD_48C00486G0002 [uncultured bacterium]|uniref:ATP synthase subunit a n=1 Tax=Candidatus Magasanikbacteria bacterium GW2011_GWE2_42_7 TaxID=1619052 RepID=A0A0G1BEX7_9BACT|nr:MAG: hypothetical protein ACD_48C00486G0002 [uncultured bacterium]KKS53190.1 MAG: ATP synthase subunit a [Candidatus Magasanikbacteria bacterium GW2011_GWC2_42_27]KKS71847.1 MAG: ATP synthase subunit a [Candidatus Magasanikbacteria bacterium GW2011_GWE2_42_7]KKT04463.1 MAG: ATP synthase subunit a [Candidatus Magasanikbacteria bacterium GW2011_GWD2_43_18]KKT26027.1 MAG: ATP synthase subunit a [Candidatus Magasanikbacteria bacterium GW2011_GWA2_43_9]HBB37690.1 hypothetical protein [Candidatus
MFFQVPSGQPEVQPEIIFSLGNLPITNAMLMGIFMTLIFGIFVIYINKSFKLVPSKFQIAVEMLVTGFVGLIQQITGNRKMAEQLLPLIGALFLFLGFGNLFGLIPGLTAITYEGVSLFRTPTNDFNMTFSIALAMVILTQVASIRAWGVFGHLGKFFKFKDLYLGFKKGLGPGFLAIIDFLIGLLDIVSEVAKVVSLSLRLFGNMYAGDVLAAILLGAFAFIIPSPWLAMNLLVGVLQAMVFGSLTAAYYTLAVEKPEEATA